MGRFTARRLTVLLLAVLTALVLFTGLSAEKARSDRLPVVTVTVESVDDWKEKTDVRKGTLSYEDGRTGMRFIMPITIHIQGGSSAHHDKKNYTIKLKNKVEMHEGWGFHRKYCLKANLIDPTHACNIVSARLAAQMQRRYGLFEGAPNAGQVDGFPVRMVLNGRPMGLYTWNIPKSAWMLGMDEGDENDGKHLAVFGKSWEPCVFFRGDEIDYEKGWRFKVGEPTPENKATFERLYQFVRDASDEEFRSNADQYLDLDACFNYYCFICASYAADNIAKNTLLVTYDGLRWAPSLYDLDSLWGIDFKGSGLYETDQGVGVRHVINCGGLFGRIRACFPDEVKARYAELRRYPLSKENIRAEFERFRAEIPESCYSEDHALWNSDDKRIRTYELTYDLLDQYLPTVDAAFGYAEEATAPAPAPAAEGGG